MNRGSTKPNSEHQKIFSLCKAAEGISVVEVIVGTAILVGIFLVMGSIAQYALYLSYASSGRIRSSLLATEGIEAIKTMRDESFAANIAPLTPGTEYYLSFLNGKWSADATQSTIDGEFTRKFVVQNVSRDALDKITSSGGANDPDTKKIIVTITWSSRNLQRQDIMSTYITNLFKN